MEKDNKTSQNEEVEVKEQEIKKRSSKKRNWIFIVVILLVLIPLIFAAISFFKTSELEKVQSSIDENLEDGNYSDAQKSIEEGLEKYPTDPGLLARQIDAYSVQGNQTGKELEMIVITEPLINDALTLHPEDSAVLISSGYAYETAGDYERALNYYEKAIESNEKSSVAHFHKGHVLAFLNRNEESDIAYSKAYELDPDNVLVQLAIAQELYKKGNIDDALSLLSKITENTKANALQRAEAHTLSSFIEFGRGNNELARSHASHAVEVDPEYSLGLGLNGYFLAFNSQTYSNGVEQLSKAIEINPRISLNYFLLGLIMRSYGLVDQAIKLQEQGLSAIENDNTLVGIEAINMTRSRMNYELGITYASIPNVTQAVGYIKSAIEENPGYKSKLLKGVSNGVFNKIQSNNAFVALTE